MDEQQTPNNAQGTPPTATPISFTKQKKVLFFKIRSKPVFANAQATPIAKPPSPPKEHKPLFQRRPPAAKAPTTQQEVYAQKVRPLANTTKKKSQYITKFITNKKGLDESLREIGLKTTPYDFVKRMIIYSIIVSIAIAVILSYVFVLLGLSSAYSIILSIVSAVALYNALFNRFASYPIARSRAIGKLIEKDILFATRDMVISMRSGMPLFNAMTAVSTGYGAASAEFGRVVSLIQLGSPIEQAIDDISEKSRSKTFKRIMLQASVSIRVGADVTSSLQSVVDDIMQERVIELRRYGQKLNALAMFYMLFGVIFPSMGVAIAVIMSTFVSLFTVDETTLLFVLVGIVGLQVIFLNLIKNSRPMFST